MNKELTGEDYYFDENDCMVFTTKYLLDRGTCCGNGCRHCPYYYINVPEPAEGAFKERDKKFSNKP